MKDKSVISYGVFFTSVLLVSGCSNQQFTKKPTQTQSQYESDMAYCRSEALGTWDDRNGVSKMNLKKGEMGVISYEDCMRQLGYEQVK